MGLAVRSLAIVVLWVGLAQAQPGLSTSELLRDANTAALAGDWLAVSAAVEPLLQRELAAADRAEVHRLIGIAAFFHQRRDVAEQHFLAYLRAELMGRLDPALYPPDVVTFFNDVASRHAAELHVLRARPRRSWKLTLLPPLGQLQNGERTKAYVLGGVLGGLLLVNLSTYYYLQKWCQQTDGPRGGGLTCDNGGDNNHAAARIRPTNIATGVGFIAVYAYGVLDGMWGYRRRSRARAVQPFATASAEAGVVGLMGRF